MQTPESASQSDYIHYPIQYPNGALSTIISNRDGAVGGSVGVWLQQIDKSKFIDGRGADYSNGTGIPNHEYKAFNVVSIGF